jgi:glycosyltransferase involved in cell wall biosynthesis
MKIAYICQYFVPEIGAPSARLNEMSREWAAAGHDVTVVTGFPNHPRGVLAPEDRGIRFRRERLGDVEVWRNWLYATPNEGFLKKTLAHLSFALSVFLFSGRRLSQFDVMIVSSPTFFVVATTYVLSRIHRIPYVFEVRDLWPGIFIELGVLRSRPLIRILEAVEMFLYRRAARVVVVTQSFAETLVRRGVPASQIATITNGVDLERFQPAPRQTVFRAANALGDTFVVLYIGAHGISQALSAVLRAAQLLAGMPDVQFVFVGDGAEKAALQERAAKMGLQNVRFLPPVDKDSVVEWYATADAVLVPLRDVPLFSGFVPSKIFEVMGAARPIVGSVRGEARAILERSGGALLAEPEDAEGIAAAVSRLRGDRTLATSLGERGREFAAQYYSRRALASQYVDVLKNIVAPDGRAAAETA